MRRALVFLLLGPLAVAISVTMALVSPVKMDPRFAELIAAIVFVPTMPVSALVGVIDSCLARRFPLAQRVGLVTAAGAIIPSALISLFSSWSAPASDVLPVAVCGAACAWLCTFLAEGPGLQRSPRGYAAALQVRSGG
jgi:hypothetical protein